MSDNNTYDPFAGMDPFGGQQVVTPDIGSVKTGGTNKLVVVLFIVDCSRTMDGDRIMAVNAALTEVKSILQDIKNNNSLDLKMAIMSFTSSAKWELQLTDIDEVSLQNLTTRAGLTQYGNAFHELNKVLRKEQFMKHTGKVAPPAIMFLTDGGPTDDYDNDLKKLLENGWFANASRSAVLLGDAINDPKAKEAVSKFVEDPDNDIVDAENSTVIIQKIKIATMHTVAGDPMGKDGKVVKDDPIQPDPIPADKPIPSDDPADDPIPTDKPIPDFVFPDDPIFPDVPIPDDPFPVDAPVDNPFPTDDPTDNPFPDVSTPDDPFPTDDPFGAGGGFDPF